MGKWLLCEEGTKALPVTTQKGQAALGGGGRSMQQGNTCVHLQSFVQGAKIHIFADTLWRFLLPREDRSKRDQKDCYLGGISKGRLRGAGAPALRDGVSTTVPSAFEEWQCYACLLTLETQQVI